VVGRRAQNFARLLYINNQKFKVTGPKEGGKESIKKNYNCKARPLPRGPLMTCPKTKTSHIKPAMLLCVCARMHARERERERERERKRERKRERERKSERERERERKRARERERREERGTS
jgi:hypothetical protein